MLLPRHPGQDHPRRWTPHPSAAADGSGPPAVVRSGNMGLRTSASWEADHDPGHAQSLRASHRRCLQAGVSRTVHRDPGTCTFLCSPRRLTRRPRGRTAQFPRRLVAQCTRTRPREPDVGIHSVHAGTQWTQVAHSPARLWVRKSVESSWNYSRLLSIAAAGTGYSSSQHALLWPDHGREAHADDPPKTRLAP